MAEVEWALVVETAMLVFDCFAIGWVIGVVTVVLAVAIVVIVLVVWAWAWCRVGVVRS